MGVENSSFGQASQEAEQAHTEYQYAAAREDIEYGEQPGETSFKEATFFLRELKSLHPNWDTIDFNRINVEHLNSLPDDEERINYAVEQLVDKDLPPAERSTLIQNLRDFLGKQKETVGKLTGVTAVLASLALMGGLVRAVVHHEQTVHQTIETSLRDGHLKIGQNIDLRPGMRRVLGEWLLRHPSAEVTVKRVDVESSREKPAYAAAEVELQVIENAKTYKVENESYEKVDDPIFGPDRAAKWEESLMRSRVRTDATEKALGDIDTQESEAQSQ